jgi:predicted nucleic acid-binding protein
MKNVFVDTNVILDFLADRRPFSEFAAKLFQLAQNGRINIHIASISINNTYYILRQVSSHSKALKLIEQILDLVVVQATNEEILRKALKSGFNDYEDAIQYFTARNTNGTEAIVTRNAKDFKKSDIPILSPETAVKLVLSKKEL